MAQGTRRPTQLGWFARGVCWVFAASFAGFGTYAVFTSQNQAGSAALLILSTVFAVIGLAGQIPQRLKFGENSVEWPEQVTDAVTAAITEGSPEVAEKVVAAIADSAPQGVQSLAVNRLAARTFETLAESVLKIAAAQIEATEDSRALTVSKLSLDDSGYDFELGYAHGGPLVGVFVKRVGRLGGAAIEKLIDFSNQPRIIGRFLVMLFGGLSESARDRLTREDASRITVLELDPSLDINVAVDQVREYLKSVIE